MFRSALTRLDLLESDRVDITVLSKICRVVGILKRFFGEITTCFLSLIEYILMSFVFNFLSPQYRGEVGSIGVTQENCCPAHAQPLTHISANCVCSFGS